MPSNEFPVEWWDIAERDFYAHANEIRDIHIVTRQEALNPISETSEHEYDPVTGYLILHIPFGKRDETLLKDALEESRDQISSLEDGFSQRVMSIAFLNGLIRFYHGHGFILALIGQFDDGLATAKAALKLAKKRQSLSEIQKRLVSRLIHREMAKGLTRQKADEAVAKLVAKVAKRGGYGGLTADWFEKLLLPFDEDPKKEKQRLLRPAFAQKGLTMKDVGRFGLEWTDCATLKDRFS